jgi:hypothetical protein
MAGGREVIHIIQCACCGEQFRTAAEGYVCREFLQHMRRDCPGRDSFPLPLMKDGFRDEEWDDYVARCRKWVQSNAITIRGANDENRQ